MDSLYNENHILGRLFRKFMDLFPQATKPTKKLLALFLYRKGNRCKNLLPIFSYLYFYHVPVSKAA